jgi:hypothetical protein
VSNVEVLQHGKKILIDGVKLKRVKGNLYKGRSRAASLGGEKRKPTRWIVRKTSEGLSVKISEAATARLNGKKKAKCKFQSKGLLTSSTS